MQHYSIHTERSHVEWIRRFARFHRMRSRADLFPAESKIEAFLTDLALQGKVAVATVLVFMEGTPHLVAKLLYGSGSRIMEAVRLRVKDIDFAMKQLTVRSGKGDKDRFTTFPPRSSRSSRTTWAGSKRCTSRIWRRAMGRSGSPVAITWTPASSIHRPPHHHQVEGCGPLAQYFYGPPRQRGCGKPAVNLREQMAGTIDFALLLPQPAQADGGSEIKRFCLPAPGNTKYLFKTRLRQVCIGAALITLRSPSQNPL
jgi:hypothetical protein